VSGLSPDAVVARRAEPLTATVDGELVMLDPRTSRYFAVDAIGLRVWGLLEQPRSVVALCEALEGEFDVSPEACLRDVLAFLAQLKQADLVDIR
jgi:hypothetical protein